LSGVYIDSEEVELSSNSYIYGRESGCNTSFATVNGEYVSVEMISENLKPEEEIYWTSVTYYDFENEKNEFNKTIRVLDARYASDFSNDLSRAINSE
jgi:hypothetical protein